MIATYITSSGELVKIFFVAGISISFSPSTSLNSSPSSLSSSSLTSLIFQVDSFQFFSHECLFLVFVLAALSLPSHLFQTLLRVTFESSYCRFCSFLLFDRMVELSCQTASFLHPQWIFSYIWLIRSRACMTTLSATQTAKSSFVTTEAPSFLILDPCGYFLLRRRIYLHKTVDYRVFLYFPFLSTSLVPRNHCNPRNGNVFFLERRNLVFKSYIECVICWLLCF